MTRGKILELHAALLERYGPQGWWPLASRAGQRGFDGHGYHPGDYSSPRCSHERFEVAVGAVLTQNTSWRNVEAAITALHRLGLLAPQPLLSYPLRRLAGVIRTSGYFNQKALKLRELASFLVERSTRKAPERVDLLGLWGIGPETADSILLYAYHRPVFVVDAYTRRLLERLGWIAGKEPYMELQALFQRFLPAEAALFGEYHALIVRHAKEHCRKRPCCEGCPVYRLFCRPGKLHP